MGKQSKFNIDERIEVINRYNLESDFSEGFAVVENDNLEYAFINQNGKYISKRYRHADVGDFHEGFALVSMWENERKCDFPL